MPTPKADETEEEFVTRCIPIVIDDGTAKDGKQAAAICHSMFQEAEVKATWSAAMVNDLPDSSFLYIESGGEKDEGGKTTPRSLRHFPYKGSDGAVDLPHLRNAIARIPQSNAPGLDEDKKASLQKRAQGILADETKEEKGADPLAFADRFLAELRHQKKIEDSDPSPHHRILPSHGGEG